MKRSKHYIVKTPHSSQAILNTKQHSISYTLSRTQAVIVEYTEDEGTDMFQVSLILFNSFKYWNILDLHQRIYKHRLGVLPNLLSTLLLWTHVQAVVTVRTKDALLKVQLAGLPVEFSPIDRILESPEYMLQVLIVQEISF